MRSSTFEPILSEAGVHFVLRGKNAGNLELVWLIWKSHASVVPVPGGAYRLCSTFHDVCVLLIYEFQWQYFEEWSVLYHKMTEYQNGFVSVKKSTRNWF